MKLLSRPVVLALMQPTISDPLPKPLQNACFGNIPESSRLAARGTGGKGNCNRSVLGGLWFGLGPDFRPGLNRISGSLPTAASVHPGPGVTSGPAGRASVAEAEARSQSVRYRRGKAK